MHHIRRPRATALGRAGLQATRYIYVARSSLRLSLLSPAPFRRLLSPLRALVRPSRSQHFSFSRSGLTLPGTTNRYQRQWGFTLVERLRDDLAEVLRSGARRA